MIAPNRGVVCAGLFSSGSTWVFNIARELLGEQGRAVTLYADQFDTKVADVIRTSDRFVIKSHMPGASIRAFCAEAMVPVAMTVRDPPDAVASLMLRFGQDFEAARNAITLSAAKLLILQNQSEPLVLRYEHDFTNDAGTISRIATYFGIVVEKEQIRELQKSFAAEAVKKRIASLLSDGTLSGKNPLLECEESTQWHPFHVGDGRVGKSKDVLSTEQIAQTLDATAAFCAAHGYSPRPRADAGLLTPEGRQPDQRMLKGWVDDFTPPDLVFGWVGSGDRGPPLEIIALLNGRPVGRSVVDLERPDLAKLGDGFRGFQVRLEHPMSLAEIVRQIEFHAVHGDVDLGVVPMTYQLVQRSGSHRSGVKPS